MADRFKNLSFSFVSRPAPEQGPRSAKAWNDSFSEIAIDLTSLSTEWNKKLVPIISGLPNGTLDSAINPFQNGLDGGNIWTNQNATATGTTSTYYNSTKSRPKTILESMQDLYTYIDGIADSLQTTFNNTSAALTTEQKNRIGINIFDSDQTSSASSLDGKSERNRVNLIQVAQDLYGSSYSLDNDGNANLTNNSVMSMVDALLELHNGNWDDDITLDHSGVSVSAQADIPQSAVVDDSFAGAPANTEEDLNQIRTRIKTVAGTAAWTTTLTPLYSAGPDSLEDLLVSTAGTGVKAAGNPWGYNYSDIDGMSTRLDAIKTFTGQSTQTDASPTYSSTVFIKNGDSLETALGKLDYGQNTASGLIAGHVTHLANLITFTGQTSAADGSPTYSSTSHITTGDSLETAIGKLDAAVTVVSGLAGGGAFLPLDGSSPMAGDINLNGNSLVNVDQATATGQVTASGYQASVGDFEVISSGQGIVMLADSGTRYRITINNAGDLVSTAL